MPDRLAALVLLAAWGAMGGGACVNDPNAGSSNALDVCALSADGALCDDRQPCTANDKCLNRKCVGTLVADHTACTDGNVCTGPDECLGGICVGPALVDGTVCTDDDPCTDPDTCQQGLCRSGAPLTCDDHDVCTLDTCVAGTGCVFSPRECSMAPDASVDVMMSIDVRPDLPGLDAVDAVVDLGEGGTSDGPAADTEGVDGPGTDDAGDAPGPTADAGTDVVTGDDAGADAADAEPDADAGAGAVDGARDGEPDLSDTPPDLRARGGGCQCAWTGDAGESGPPAPALVAIALSLAGARRRRPRRA